MNFGGYYRMGFSCIVLGSFWELGLKGAETMTDQGQADALIWFIAISGFGIVCLGLAWIAERIWRLNGGGEE